MLYQDLIDYFEEQHTFDYIEDFTTNIYLGNLWKYGASPTLYIDFTAAVFSETY